MPDSIEERLTRIETKLDQMIHDDLADETRDRDIEFRMRALERHDAQLAIGGTILALIIPAIVSVVVHYALKS